MNPPDNLPPLPPVPVQREILSWAFDQFGDADFDKLSDKRMFNKLESWLMGLEAVREPAKDQPPHPGAPLDSLEGLANLRFYEGKAFTKSFTVGGNEPAKEPAAGDLPPPVDPTVIIKRIRAKEAAASELGMPTPEGIAAAKKLLDEAFGPENIDEGPVRDEPTGVEARVCEDVVEMALCEVTRVMLRPNQLYRFVVMPGCVQCKNDAAPYSKPQTTEGHE